MNIMISRERLGGAVLIFLLVAPKVFPALSVSLILMGTFVLLLSISDYMRTAPLLICLLFVCIIGLHGFVGENQVYNTFKDFWYFLNPVLALLCGVAIAKILDKNEFLFSVCVAAVILSVMHLHVFVLDPQLLYQGGKEVREIAGKGSVFIGIAFAILLYSFISKSYIFTNFWTFSLLLLFFMSIYLSFSRTLWVCVFISTFVMFDLYRKALWLFIILALLAAAGAVVLNISGNSDIVTKFINPFAELGQFVTWDFQDVNTNWRGYEIYLVEQKMGESSTVQKMFGFGFGYLLDLGLSIKLGLEEMEAIPVLHSGFYYVLLKTGFSGFVFYMLFHIYLFLTGFQSKNIQRKILISLSLCLFIMSFVVSGIYNKSSAVPLLIMCGYLYAIRLYVSDEKFN